MAKPTVVIADEHPSTRDALRGAFQGHIVVLGEANNADMAVNKVIDHRPDLLVIDYKTSGKGSFNACETIVNDTDTRVLIYTGDMQIESLVDHSMRAGVSGIAIKGRESEAEICEMLLDMHARDAKYYAPKWHVRQQTIETGKATRIDAAELSVRQVAIMQEICCGRNWVETCSRLGVSKNTCNRELAVARDLLNVQTNIELIAIASDEGLVSHDMCVVS